MDRERVDHVLATIDEAIDDWTSPDAMRWRPPGSGDVADDAPNPAPVRVWVVPPPPLPRALTRDEYAAGVAYLAPYMASIHAQMTELCRRRLGQDAVVQVPASAPDAVIGGQVFGLRIVPLIGIDRPTVVPVGVSLAGLHLGTPESH